MPTSFVELELANIDEGRFLGDAEETFRKLTKDLIGHCEKHGDAQATMTAKVTVKRKDGNYVIVTDTEAKLPKRPAKVTTALVDHNQTEEVCLFTKFTGTDKDNPRQMKFCREDGSLPKD